MATESELFTRQGAPRLTPNLLTSPTEQNPVRVEPRDKELPFLLRATRDKEVSFLTPPSLVVQKRSSPEPTGAVPRWQTPVMDHSNFVPAVIPQATAKNDSLPALDQLCLSAGVCDVVSGDIPRLDSLLNVESSAQVTKDQGDQRFRSSSSSNMYDSSSSSNDSESRLQPSATAQKEIPFFGSK